MTSTETAPGGTDNLSNQETDRLISSSKVEGTAVFNRGGERLGTVVNFMLDKYSGQVAYAVLTTAGSGRSEGSHYPLPWKVLTYDTGRGGYVIDLDRDKLRSAPTYKAGEEPDWSDQAFGRSVHDYYDVPLYFGAH